MIKERDQTLAKAMSLGEEISRIGAEKEGEVTRLEKEKEEEVVRLKKEKEEEVMRLKKEKEEEITRLEKEKEEEVTRLEKEKEEEVVRLQKEKEEEVTRFDKEKEEEVTRLKKEKEEEVMRLKGELEGVRGERDAKVASLRAASDHVTAARADSDLLQKQVASLERAAADLEEKGRKEVVSMERECERKLSVLVKDLERTEARLKAAEDEGGRKREGLESKVRSDQPNTR